MANDVIQLDKVRDQKKAEKKRASERLFFGSLVSVYGVESQGRLRKVDLIDVSQGGLSLRVPYQTENLWPKQSENVTIRLYFSPEQFLEVAVNVKNSRPMIEDGVKYVRYGCAVDAAGKNTDQNIDAWQKFVAFLSAFAEVSQNDSGNVTVSNF